MGIIGTVFFAPRLAVAQGGSEIWAVQKLRVYCNACHGLGRLRFIYSDDDEQVWSYLFSESAPISKKPWAQAIIEVLDWPSDLPPPFEKPIAPDKDWMPKGEKRLRLADDTENGVSARRRIIEALQKQKP